MDLPLNERSFQVERKHITIELRENSQGRFLRITEAVCGRCNMIIVPVSGLEQVLSTLSEIIAFSKALPPQTLCNRSAKLIAGAPL